MVALAARCVRGCVSFLPFEEPIKSALSLSLFLWLVIFAPIEYYISDPPKLNYYILPKRLSLSSPLASGAHAIFQPTNRPAHFTRKSEPFSGRAHYYRSLSLYYGPTVAQHKHSIEWRGVSKEQWRERDANELDLLWPADARSLPRPIR